MSESFVHTNTFDAPVDRVYAAIANGDQHGAFTGAPASIDPTGGTPFTTHGGAIEGWTLAAADGEYLVQAWRPADWPGGVYSLVRYDFSPNGSGSEIQLTHSSIPDGGSPHLEAGWNERYWGPLRDYLAE